MKLHAAAEEKAFGQFSRQHVFLARKVASKTLAGIAFPRERSPGIFPSVDPISTKPSFVEGTG